VSADPDANLTALGRQLFAASDREGELRDDLIEESNA
jgi:hypothetical protein